MADAAAVRPPDQPHRRTYTLRDLPLDVLSLILSFIPDFQQRFEHPRWACRELAAASVPPSVAWTDVSLSWKLPPYFFPAIKRAATAVRTAHDLHVPWKGFTPEYALTALDTAFTAIAPYLEDLRGDAFMSRAREVFLADGLAPHLGAATRLTRLWLKDLRIEGPPGMIASGGGAFPEVWCALGRMPQRDMCIFTGNPIPALTLHRGLTAAAAAARRPVQLTGLSEVNFIGPVDGEPPAENALAEMGADSLTSLKVAFEFYGARFYDWHARMVNIVDALPHLRELHVNKHVCRTHEADGEFDLRGVRRAPPYLSKLTFKTTLSDECEVALPPVIVGNLASLSVSHVPPSGPPACLADPTCAFTRLTRLAYGGFGRSLNLAPWSDPRFHLPNLVEMEVTTVTVTLDGGPVGQAWAVAVATETLPRLAILKIVGWNFHTYDRTRVMTDERKQLLTAIMFVCRTTDSWENLYSSRARKPRCAGCGAVACAGAEAMADTVMRGLPAAAAEAGRRLVVPLDVLQSGAGGPPCLLLKYESMPG